MRLVGLLMLVGALACGGQVVADGSAGPSAVPFQRQAIDKVDVLLAIDNSPSMVEKQQLLADAVPTFFARLVNPDCVDNTTGAHVPGDHGGGDLQCATIANTMPEFPPVHDLHVGIVSSSLGSGGLTDPGEPCVVSGDDTTHQDDRGHLLNRTYDATANDDGPPVENVEPTDGNGGNFLAWLPASDPKNAGKSPPNVTPYSDGQEQSFVTDFQSLVTGVQQHGCGLEAQLESWYRFLIQPDPYDHLERSTDSPPRVNLAGVDATLLKMRHDFLRPDSLVLILQLTDEDDSWSDPLWGGDANNGGFGWTVRSEHFPGGPGGGLGPRGTSACDLANLDPNDPTSTGPNSPNCTSCAFTGSGADPNCTSCADGATGCQPGWYTAQQDGLNVRYGEQLMKPRYGLDPQFPIERYVDGLTSPKVPDRYGESHAWPTWDPNSGNDASSADPEHACTNPLFAADLPDGSDTSQGALCDLTPGPRTPDLVFYALLGGVPSSLVEDANGNPAAPDWVHVLGEDPDHFDFNGIDPHMIDSIAPRQGLEAPGSSYNLGSDPESGRDWNTLTSAAGIDLQYACTFDLPAEKDCSAAENAGACDCVGAATTAADGPPLCDPTNRTMQLKGKAYPTVRELRVAKGLGDHGVVASLCAKVVTGNTADPTYGYNPAMNAIVDRLGPALAGATCLSRPLPKNADGTVGCDVLVVYPDATNQAAGCTDPGMSQPPPDVLSSFHAEYEAALGGVSGPVPVVCLYEQLVGSCAGSPNAGWCYVEGVASTGCAQTILFGGSGPPTGTTLDLECLN